MWTLVHERSEKSNWCPAGIINLEEVEFEGDTLDGTEHECDKEDTHDDEHKCGECGLEWPS